MKKLFLALILSGICFACSNDDTEIPEEKYRISYSGESIEMVQHDTISVTFNIEQLVTENINYFFEPIGFVSSETGGTSISSTVMFDGFEYYSSTSNKIAGVKGDNTFQFIPHDIVPTGILTIWVSIQYNNQRNKIDIPLKVRPNPDFQ